MNEPSAFVLVLMIVLAQLELLDILEYCCALR